MMILLGLINMTTHSGEILYRRTSKVLWEGLNVKWTPLVGSVSISDWPFKAAVHLSNWLRTLQLPQLTGGCSQIWNKFRFGLVRSDNDCLSICLSVTLVIVCFNTSIFILFCLDSHQERAIDVIRGCKTELCRLETEGKILNRSRLESNQTAIRLCHTVGAKTNSSFWCDIRTNQN